MHTNHRFDELKTTTTVVVPTAWPIQRIGRLTVRADQIAACLAAEGQWRYWKGEAALAERTLTEALRMAPADTPRQFLYGIGIYLARSLADRGALEEAEWLLQKRLQPEDKAAQGLFSEQVGVVEVLADVLCRKIRPRRTDSPGNDRFAARACAGRTGPFRRSAPSLRGRVEISGAGFGGRTAAGRRRRVCKVVSW